MLATAPPKFSVGADACDSNESYVYEMTQRMSECRGMPPTSATITSLSSTTSSHDKLDERDDDELSEMTP
jgi:hypothetical protein